MPGLTADESAAFVLMKEASDKPILVDDDSQPEAEEAEVEAAVEEDEQPAPQPEKVEKPRKYVPHEALHAEREERKKAEAETLRLSQQMAALNERIRLSQQMAEQESARAQEKIPTSLEDPIAVLQRLEQKERDAERQRADEALPIWRGTAGHRSTPLPSTTRARSTCSRRRMTARTSTMPTSS
jgi:hypothetical protein